MIYMRRHEVSEQKCRQQRICNSSLTDSSLELSFSTRMNEQITKSYLNLTSLGMNKISYRRALKIM
jgi:hypothetical protein